MSEFYNEQVDTSFLYGEEESYVRQSEADTKAAVSSVIVGDDAAQRIRSELLRNGESAQIDAILQYQQEQERMRNEGDVYEVLASDLPVNQKRDTVRKIVEEMDSKRMPNLYDTVQEYALINAQSKDNNAELIHEGMAENYHKIMEVRREIERLPAELGFEGGATRQAFDTLAATILPGWSINVGEVINATVPGLISGLEHVAAGNAIKKFQDHVRAQPPEEQLRLLRQLTENINNNTFFTSNNGYMKFDLMDSIINDLHSSNTEVTMNNIFSALDFVGFGLIRGAGKAGRAGLGRIFGGKKVSRIVKAEDGTEIRVDAREKSIDEAVKRVEEVVSNPMERKDKRSLSSAADQVAPEESRAMAEAAINDDTGQTAARMGETRVRQTNEHVLPRAPGDTVRAVPDVNDDVDTIIDYDPSRAFATQREIDVAMTAMDERLQALETATPRVHLNKLEPQTIDGGYRAKYRIGDTALNGYSSLNLAKKIASTFRRSVNDANVRILARKWDTGEFVPLEEFRAGGSVDDLPDLPPPKRPDMDSVKSTIDRVQGKLGEMNLTQLRKALSGSSLRKVKGDTKQDMIDRLLAAREAAEVLKQYPSLRSFEEAIKAGYIDKEDVFRWYNAVRRGKQSTNDPVNSLLNAEGIYNWAARANAIDKDLPRRTPDEQAHHDAQKAGTDLSTGKNEYMVELEVEERLNKNWALEDTELTHGKDKAFLGKAASFLDKSSVFLRWITRAGNIAADAESAKIKALEQVMKPMTDLKPKQQDYVLQALDEGDREAKWFTNEELVDRWGERPDVHKLIAAYESVRRHQKYVHRMLNDAVRRRLVADNYKWLRMPKGLPIDENEFLARQVTRGDLKAKDMHGNETEIKEIWRPDMGRAVPVDSKMLNDWNEPENMFVELRNPVVQGGKQYKFAYIPKGANTELRPLPQHVIREIPGYISRVYDAPYMLKKVTRRMTDGVYEGEVLKTVRMYSNKGDAQADFERMMLEAEEGVSYKIVEAKELRHDEEYAQRVSLEYFEDSGQLFTSRRGFEIKGIDGRRELKPVSESILASRAKAARAGTIDLVVDKLTANWEKKFGKKYGINGRMPLDNESLVRNSRVLDDIEDFDEAVAMQRHIKMLAGIDDSTMTHAFREMAINFANRIVENYDNSLLRHVMSEQKVRDLSAFVLRNRNKNIINGAKALAFTKFIIFNPIRQLFLQSQQATVYLGMEHGFKYFMSRRGAQDYWGLMGGMLFRTTDMWKGQRKRGAFLMGMEENEYEEFVDAYRRSGLPASIDSHQYAMLVAFDRNMGTRNPAGIAKRAYDDIRKPFRRLGFDAGEQAQLMAAFLGARNRWMKNNPKIANKWNETENLAQIAGDAREISFNMNKAGTMQFQKGGLSLMFQFLSHMTKATQVLLPQGEKVLGIRNPRVVGKLSNKAFTNKEKGRIALMQLGMYGTGAYGVNATFERILAETEAQTGVLVPTEFVSIAEEGLLGTLMNFGVALAVGEDNPELDTDIEFSSTMAPFSGIFGNRGIFGNPMGVLIDAFLLSDPSVAETFLGPVYQVLRDGSEALQFTSAVVGANWYQRKLPDGKDAILVLDEWGRQFLPMYNNFIRGRAEEAMNRYISNSGREGVQITDGEAFARRWLGTTPRRQRQVNELMMDLNGIIGHPQRDRITAELDDTAEQYYKYVMRRLSESGSKAELMTVAQEVDKMAQGMRMVLDDSEYRYIFDKKIRDMIYSDVNSEGTEAELVTRVINLFNRGVPDVYDPAFIEELRNFTDFPGKEIPIKWIEDIR